jgi:hypothetical protein
VFALPEQTQALALFGLEVDEFRNALSFCYFAALWPIGIPTELFVVRKAIAQRGWIDRVLKLTNNEPIATNSPS